MGLYEVSVEQGFVASHAVRLPDGRTEAPHEHAWRVKARFRAAGLAEPMGVVVDFAELQEVLGAITAQLDGQDLNQLGAFGEGGASAERVAEMLARELAARMDPADKLYCVEVTEAPGCTAAFYPDARGT